MEPRRPLCPQADPLLKVQEPSRWPDHRHRLNRRMILATLQMVGNEADKADE
jgi:hypothetical protein